MYLAPLNYDRFFKKVFGKKRFAKAFLEDFLNIKIKKIEILERKNFITDKALPIEFDYRCSLDNGEQVIVEMQQWYKTDITRRFYLYHSLSTSLQLENLEEEIISIDNKTGKIIKDKLYNNLKPSITLIWMVDDNLNFTEDFVTFKMGVEDLHNFVKDDDLWNKPFDKILAERERVLNIQDNNTKDLDFLSKNKLTFIFQKNIAKNISKNKQDKYSKWFDFALKTKNKKNKKSDFKDYESNELFISIMNVLLKDKLTEEEIKYISKEDELKDAYVKYTSVLINAQKKAENAQKEAENAQKEAESAQKEAESAQKEKDNAQKEKENALKEKEDILKASITKFLSMNLSVSEIAEILGVSEELVNSLSEYKQ